MDPGNQDKLRQRVEAAAEKALHARQYVSAIDVLLDIGWLAPAKLTEWRTGKLRHLEAGIQANLSKISEALRLLRAWAEGKGLNPRESGYQRTTRGGRMPLQFSASGNPGIEKTYRTHYVSPALAEAKRAKAADKQLAEPDILVFETFRENQCSDCGIEIPPGDHIFLEASQTFCLACAGLSDLVFLPRGDTALTRRATKASSKVAIVLRFSQSRRRNERQGLLVAEAALAAAEAECLQDAEARAKAREQARTTRARDDQKFALRMAAKILEIFPACPSAEADLISKWTARRGSGRVGRSAAGQELAEAALVLAVRASVRHRHTPYDELLASGTPRPDARARVAKQIDHLLATWKQPVTAGRETEPIAD